MIYGGFRFGYEGLTQTKATPEFLRRMYESISGIVPIKRSSRLVRLVEESSPKTRETIVGRIAKM